MILGHLILNFCFQITLFIIKTNQSLTQEFTQEMFDTNFLLGKNIFMPRTIKVLAQLYDVEVWG